MCGINNRRKTHEKVIVFLVFILGTLGLYGQTKNDDILKISGSANLANQMIDAMIPQFQQLVPQIPPAFWVKFKEKINMDDLFYACIPVYDKYYTHDKIKQLIIFYESPLGRKTVEVTPLLSQETMAIGQKWGETIAQEVVNELINDGYINN
jgi:hypothetical protein